MRQPPRWREQFAHHAVRSTPAVRHVRPREGAARAATAPSGASAATGSRNKQRLLCCLQLAHHSARSPPSVLHAGRRARAAGSGAESSGTAGGGTGASPARWAGSSLTAGAAAGTAARRGGRGPTILRRSRRCTLSITTLWAGTSAGRRTTRSRRMAAKTRAWNSKSCVSASHSSAAVGVPAGQPVQMRRPRLRAACTRSISDPAANMAHVEAP